MSIARSRRDLVKGLAGAGMAFALARSFAVARQANGIASGGIGLTRAEWEAIYGPGEALQTFARYTDPAYGGPIYVGMDFENVDDGLVEFIELQWANLNQLGGMRQEYAEDATRGLLPDDARLHETFYMPATPGGPIALRSQRWTSAALADLTGDRMSILIIFQEKTGQINPDSPVEIIVTAATIAVEDA
jgi:hypothetical protein